MKPTEAFAVGDRDGKIMLQTIRSSRADSITAMVDSKLIETTISERTKQWARYRRWGYRCVRVEIREVEP